MKVPIGQARDIYHGELLDLREFLQQQSPPVPFPSAMISVLRWFKSLPPERKHQILTTEPENTETYDTRGDHKTGAPRARRNQAATRKPVPRNPS